jgi:hypothetical protein
LPFKSDLVFTGSGNEWDYFNGLIHPTA